LKRRTSESIFYWIRNLIVPCLAQGMFMCGCACQETGCIFSSYPAAPAPTESTSFSDNTSPSTHHPFNSPRQRMPCSIFIPSLHSPITSLLPALLFRQSSFFAPAHSTDRIYSTPFIPIRPPLSLSLFLTCSYLHYPFISIPQNSFHPPVPSPSPQQATSSSRSQMAFFLLGKRGNAEVEKWEVGEGIGGWGMRFGKGWRNCGEWK